MAKSLLFALAASAALIAGPTAGIAADVSLDLKYGVLAGLTGDPAADGQAWNEAARLGVAEIAKSLQRLGLSTIKVELADSQDSQGSPASRPRRSSSMSIMSRWSSATSIRR